MEPIKHEVIWAFVSMDHVGPFPKTSRGYTHILVIMDRFSRWVELTRVRGDKEDGELRAKFTLYKFKKRVVKHHGLPGAVLTDGSTSFMGEFDAYLKENKWVEKYPINLRKVRQGHLGTFASSKVKGFMWLLCSHALPVGTRLRGSNAKAECPHCGIPEDIKHMVFDC